MSENFKQKLTRPSIWVRLVSMIVLAVAFYVAGIVIAAVVVFQFLAALFTINPNDQFVRFGRNLARYLQQIVTFMTFATEEKPFPFSSWPDEPHKPAQTEKNDQLKSGEAENVETEVEDGTAKRGKPAARKTAATRKSPKSPKKDS